MSKRYTYATLAMALFAASTASAQENERALERLEVTMTLLPEQARDATEITRRIELPPAAEARGNASERGAQPPGDAGQRGRETAAEARERGREFGQQVAEEARQNRENVGRGDGAGRPEGVPTGPPTDRPAPPANPGRP